MPYGTLIRQIRQAKHIRLADLADDQLSEALLSRFERGQTDITLTKFLHLLHRLHVTPEEFVLLADQPRRIGPDFFGHFSDFYFRIDAIGHMENKEKALLRAQNLVTVTAQDYRTAPTRWHLLNWRGAQIHLQRAKHNLDMPDTAVIDLTPVQEYLLNLDMWTAVDMQVYAFFLSELADDANHLILQAAAKHIPERMLDSSWQRILFPAGESQFMAFMVHGKMAYARDTLAILEQITARSPNAMDGQVHLIFLTGWLAFVTGSDQTAGRQKMDQAISIFTILDHRLEASRYRQLKEQITGADPTPILPDIWL